MSDATIAAASSKQTVYEVIRQAIVDRKLGPGTKLTEDTLAETFGCGRGAVRWALARLSDEGLVTVVPNRGASVAQPPLDEARHLFGARKLLEGGIVRCLGQCHPAEGWKPLLECIAAEDRAHDEGDDATALRLSGDFHLIMATLTGNPIIAQMLRQLVSRTVLAIAVHQRAGTSGCRTHEHRRLVELLQNGDIEGAVREMEDHLNAIEKGLDLFPKQQAEPNLKAVLRATLQAKSL